MPFASCSIWSRGFFQFDREHVRTPPGPKAGRQAGHRRFSPEWAHEPLIAVALLIAFWANGSVFADEEAAPARPYASPGFADFASLSRCV